MDEKVLKKVLVGLVKHVEYLKDLIDDHKHIDIDGGCVIPTHLLTCYRKFDISDIDDLIDDSFED